jgi:glycine cleavage system pyridoxal-binding protein P
MLITDKANSNICVATVVLFSCCSLYVENTGLDKFSQEVVCSAQCVSGHPLCLSCLLRRVTQEGE